MNSSDAMPNPEPPPAETPAEKVTRISAEFAVAIEAKIAALQLDGIDDDAVKHRSGALAALQIADAIMKRLSSEPSAADGPQDFAGGLTYAVGQAGYSLAAWATLLERSQPEAVIGQDVTPSQARLLGMAFMMIDMGDPAAVAAFLQAAGMRS